MSIQPLLFRCCKSIIVNSYHCSNQISANRSMRECLDVADRLSTIFSHHSQQLHYSIPIYIYTIKYHVKSKFELSTLFNETLNHYLWLDSYPIIPVKMTSGSPVSIKPEPAIIVTLQQYKIMTRMMPLLHLSHLNP